MRALWGANTPVCTRILGIDSIGFSCVALYCEPGFTDCVGVLVMTLPMHIYDTQDRVTYFVVHMCVHFGTAIVLWLFHRDSGS